MTALVTQRVHRLAVSLAELKVKVRAALATELAGAVGLAVRDVLVAALIDEVLRSPTRSPAPASRPGGWREDGYEDRDRWGEPRDPWADPDEYEPFLCPFPVSSLFFRDPWADPDEYEPRARPPARYEPLERNNVERTPRIPTAAAVAVGVNVGRWWLARQGTVPAAIGFGVLATALGLAGGPVAWAALAVLAAATDVLTAESALARIDPS